MYKILRPVKILIVYGPVLFVAIAFSTVFAAMYVSYNPGSCECKNNIVTCVKNDKKYYKNGCTPNDPLALIDGKLVSLLFIQPWFYIMILMPLIGITALVTVIINVKCQIIDTRLCPYVPGYEPLNDEQSV